MPSIYPFPSGLLHRQTLRYPDVTEVNLNDSGNVDRCKTCWRHKMETFFALLVILCGNSPVTGEFSAQRPVTRSFDFFLRTWINGWISNREAGDFRRHRTHYDVTVMSVIKKPSKPWRVCKWLRCIASLLLCFQSFSHFENTLNMVCLLWLAKQLAPCGP